MQPDDDDAPDVGRFAAAVADIARALESPHDADARIAHVLTLVRRVVPCDRCALYRRNADGDPGIIVAPVVPAAERNRLAGLLQSILQVMDGEAEHPRPFESRAHLALPIVGGEAMLGVLFVDCDREEEYAPYHLRLLSAVASQLGAYLMMQRLHHETAQQAVLLTEREQQLRGAARFREEFIGVVGHDLRNPLSAIRTGAHLLMKRAGLEPRDHAVAERIIGSADRMSRMIDELLDFARGRLGGGIPLRRTLVDLHELCREVVDEAQAAHGRAVELQATGQASGFWDRDRLAQLVSNLVGNALQHSTPDALVRVTVRDAGEAATIEVNNRGDVIPADQIACLFEPFRRGEHSQAAGSGLGLGLYIVDRIVHAHGGAIAATSSAEEGTTFAVTLPRRRASDRSGVDR